MQPLSELVPRGTGDQVLLEQGVQIGFAPAAPSRYLVSAAGLICRRPMLVDLRDLPCKLAAETAVARPSGIVAYETVQAAPKFLGGHHCFVEVCHIALAHAVAGLSLGA